MKQREQETKKKKERRKKGEKRKKLREAMFARADERSLVLQSLAKSYSGGYAMHDGRSRS